MNYCLLCGAIIKKGSSKYCSNLCQSGYRYRQYIKDWKSGFKTGSRGINTKNLSNHLKRYLYDKYDSKCSACGWNEVNTYTGNIPLEIDHIDGNSENNTESNLRLLCPSCHALTPSFRNLNKGNGRVWRRDKYVKIT